MVYYHRGLGVRPWITEHRVVFCLRSMGRLSSRINVPTAKCNINKCVQSNPKWPLTCKNGYTFWLFHKTRGLSAWQLRCLIVYATLMMSNCLWYTAKLIPNDLVLTFQCHPRSNVMGQTERPYMIYYMCFMQNLIRRCSMQEMQPFESHVTLIWPWNGYPILSIVEVNW